MRHAAVANKGNSQQGNARSARHLADCCEFLFLRKGVEALKVILPEREDSASDICRFTISVFAKRGAHVVFVDAKEAI